MIQLISATRRYARLFRQPPKPRPFGRGYGGVSIGRFRRKRKIQASCRPIRYCWRRHVRHSIGQYPTTHRTQRTTFAGGGGAVAKRYLRVESGRMTTARTRHRKAARPCMASRTIGVTGAWHSQWLSATTNLKRPTNPRAGRWESSPFRARRMSTIRYDSSHSTLAVSVFGVAGKWAGRFAPGPWFASTPTRGVPVLTARSTDKHACTSCYGEQILNCCHHNNRPLRVPAQSTFVR